MKLSFKVALATGLTFLTACSGRTVQLDHESTAGGAGAANEPDGPTRIYQPPGARLTEGILLVDEQRLYWQAAGGAFRSCLKEDCEHSVVTYAASTTELSSAGIQLYANVAVSEGSVFWLASPPRGTLFTCPRAGCGAEPTRLMRDPSLWLEGLVADQGGAYWLSSNELYRCAAGGCGNSPERTPFGEGALPLFFGTDAFWVLQSHIRRAPKDGSSAAVTIIEGDQASGIGFGTGEIAVNSRYVYWLDGTSRILRCPFSGCEGDPTVLEAEAGEKVRLRADELGVYWMDRHESVEGSAVVRHYGAIHFCADSGCAPSTALGTFDELDTYVLDEDFIYFTARLPRTPSPVGGDIMRMPKPRP